MMTRHWQILILKGREQIRLFVTTTSSMIDVDLGGDSEQSLIRKARQFHRHGQNEEQNHRDLAIGAIMSFAGGTPYDISDTHVAPCADVPDCEANFHVGGRGRGNSIPIWEMHAAVPDWV